MGLPLLRANTTLTMGRVVPTRQEGQIVAEVLVQCLGAITIWAIIIYTREPWADLRRDLDPAAGGVRIDVLQSRALLLAGMPALV